MAFYRITWNPKYRFATLHNWGCNFKCPFCSYKLRSGAQGRSGFAEPRPARFLSVDEQKETLKRLQPETVYFMGGEPSLAPELAEMVRFAKEELGASAKLGHTNGSNLDIPGLDGANVGFKAWSEERHREITGKPKSLIYDGFTRAVKRKLAMKANLVFVPGLVGLDELEGLAGYLADLDPEIPFHIMGYIPVPGLDYARPTEEEMREAELLAKRYLRHVGVSHLSSAEALDLTARDDRFRVQVAAGV